MNGELILKAMTDINDRFIAEAADEEHIKAVFCTEQENVTPSDKQKNTRVKFRRILLVAVISALVLIAAAVAVTSFLWNSLAALEAFDGLLDMEVGEETEFQGGTIIKGGDIIKFSSAEEAIAETGLRFLYPTVWPDGVEAVDILCFEGDYDENYNFTKEYIRIIFSTNTPETVSIIIHTHPNYNRAFLSREEVKKVTINNYECYYVISDGIMEFWLIHNGYLYDIMAATYEDAVTIVEGMQMCK